MTIWQYMLQHLAVLTLSTICMILVVVLMALIFSGGRRND